MKAPSASVVLALTATVLINLALRTNALAFIDQPHGGVPVGATKNDGVDPRPAPSGPPPDEESLREYADFASSLADAAAEEIRPYWRAPRRALGQQIKLEEGRSLSQSASPVTLADRAAERAMRDLIERRFPGHGIYGEEYGVKDADADWVWVLDPIDGTRSFITGKPLFGTLISLLYKGTPVIGIIDQCVLSERWLGVVGQQSTLNGVPIETDGVKLLSEAEMYSTTPDMFRRGDELARFDAMRSAVRTPHYGADCYAYALVASGFGADLVVEADLGPHDWCALVPVLEGAGGAISDWTGQPLMLQGSGPPGGRVVASANPTLHAQALSILSAPAAKGVAASRDDGLPAAADGAPLRLSNPSVTPLICGLLLGEMMAHFGP